MMGREMNRLTLTFDITRAWFITAGNKDKLIARLQRAQGSQKEFAKAKRAVTEFIAPTKKVQSTTEPTVNSYYARNFNLVDRFDQIISWIEFKPRIATEQQRVFYSLIQYGVAETYLLLNDYYGNFAKTGKEKPRIRSFTKALALSLKQSFL